MTIITMGKLVTPFFSRVQHLPNMVMQNKCIFVLYQSFARISWIVS